MSMQKTLDEVEPDIDSIREQSNEASLTWLVGRYLNAY